MSQELRQTTETWGLCGDGMKKYIRYGEERASGMTSPRS